MFVVCPVVFLDNSKRVWTLTLNPSGALVNLLGIGNGQARSAMVFELYEVQIEL